MADMKVEAIGDEGFIIHNPDREVIALMTWMRLIKLEAAGMRRRGRSVRAIAKEHFGLSRGTKDDVIQERIATRLTELGYPPQVL